MDPNQVVAYNLARARQLRGLTQDEAAAALEPFLGVRWSKASFSQAERSVGGKFVRRFDAEEIVAFARAFEVPITWFFLPPPPWRDGVPVKLSTADSHRFGTEVALLVDLVFGDNADQRDLLEARLAEFMEGQRLAQTGGVMMTRGRRRQMGGVDKVASGRWRVSTPWPMRSRPDSGPWSCWPPSAVCAAVSFSG